MDKLSQLKHFTRVVADSGDIEQIKAYQPEDATTNPSLILKAAQMPAYASIFEQARRACSHLQGSVYTAAVMDRLAVGFGVEILQHIPGRVSTEVNARLSFDTDGTVAEARNLIQLYESHNIPRERVLIKIAATWEGIKAARILEQEGIHCNLTLIFHPVQAAACAEAGATLVSPFVGRITDWYQKAEKRQDFPPVENDEGVQSVRTIYHYFKYFGYATTVMGASFRHVGQVEALAGCDALTISPELLGQLRQDEGELGKQLDAAQPPALKPMDTSENGLRWQLNECPMATEKLAEGIRKFAGDTRTLENLVQSPSH